MLHVAMWWLAVNVLGTLVVGATLSRQRPGNRRALPLRLVAPRRRAPRRWMGRWRALGASMLARRGR